MLFNEFGDKNKKIILCMHGMCQDLPSVIDYLKYYNLYDYFDKVYVSSIYGVKKNYKKFYKYVIDDYNRKKGEALFVDDSDDNLDNACEMGFDVLLMDRDNKVNQNKYKIINNLLNI